MLYEIKSQDDLWEKVSSGLFVMDFYTNWCKPCKIVAPHFSKLADEYPDVSFCKIDGDINDDLIDSFQIEGFPTFIVGKRVDHECNILERFVGGDQMDDLRSFLTKTIAHDENHYST